MSAAVERLNEDKASAVLDVGAAMTEALAGKPARPTKFDEPVEVLLERVRDVVEATGREITSIGAKVWANANDVEVLHCKVKLAGGGDFESRRRADCDPSTPWVDPAVMEWCQ